MPESNHDLQNALKTGFIDKSFHSQEALQPSLVLNDRHRSQCVLEAVISELSACQEFFISVAFLTKSGIAVLLNALLDARSRGVSGKMIVSEYLTFTQPEGLKALLQFDNIQVRVATTGNMHGKGYLFSNDGLDTILIGSSNLTASALKTNNELNIRLKASGNSRVSENLISHFSETFSKAVNADEDYIAEYEQRYLESKTRAAEVPIGELREKNQDIAPNSMQSAALESIQKLRDSGESRALIISATGTGKTYLSAFDVKAINPMRVLFVVHRRNIAIAAMETYRSLFGEDKSYGIYSGTERNIDADFVFATVQTISREEHYQSINASHFDYVIVDETHRAGADSYQRLIRYLQPKFLLGMTATPERTDGHDIFSDFDHNIAYEIRLHQAMEEDILAPFHYFGVTDISVDGEALDDHSSFNSLVSEQRVGHILEQASIYGCDDGVVRGLIFCSRKEECSGLSSLLNQRGLKTIALTGDDSESAREEAIKRLESDDENWKLDYVLTVDIFNEGIDIPRVNQILMLRPTGSAIIFVQQLGRGLRKAKKKEYLTVIDFIGNYQNNYLVPIALYGDRSYSKDKIRRLMSSGSTLIPGSSTIDFDQISKRRIFEAIDSINLKKLKDLKADYNLLKFELGRSPMMMDFIDYGARDPFSFVEKYGSYFQFVLKVDPDNVQKLSLEAVSLLSAFSKEINNGKRVEESLALRQIVQFGEVSHESLAKEVVDIFGYRPSRRTIESVFNNLNLGFVTVKLGGNIVPLREKLGYEVIEVLDESCSAGEQLGEFIKNTTFSSYLNDSIDYSISTWSEAFERSELLDGFNLYEKYSRKDVFRILNWQSNPVAQNVGGYKISEDGGDCAIFITYEKHDHSSSTQYEDEFVDESQFQWMSKNNRYLTSPEIVRLKNENEPLRLPLFVKKSNDEGVDFYYMGEMTAIQNSYEETTIKNEDGDNLPVVTMRFDLNPPVAPRIYQYITADDPLSN